MYKETLMNLSSSNQGKDKDKKPKSPNTKAPTCQNCPDYPSTRPEC
jgi:hypothetical protein